MGTLVDWLREKEFTLALSPGFFGFFAHTGVLLALDDHGLRPARLTGGSAGALVAAAYGAGREAQELADELMSLKRADFWDPFPGPGLLRGKKFAQRLGQVLPVVRLEECRVPVTISIFDIRSRRTRVVERGEINAAVRASCALPGLFWPVRVDGRLSLDGGIKDPWGLAGAAPKERVLLHQLGHNERRRPVPARAELEVLAFDDLPAVNPFRLDEGRRAFHHARERASRALERTR